MRMFGKRLRMGLIVSPFIPFERTSELTASGYLGQTPSTSAYRTGMKNFIEGVIGPTSISETSTLNLASGASSPSSPSSRRSLALPPDAGKKKIPDVRWHWKDGKLHKRELGNRDKDIPPMEWFAYPGEPGSETV